MVRRQRLVVGRNRRHGPQADYEPSLRRVVSVLRNARQRLRGILRRGGGGGRWIPQVITQRVPAGRVHWPLLLQSAA